MEGIRLPDDTGMLDGAGRGIDEIACCAAGTKPVLRTGVVDVAVREQQRLYARRAERGSGRMARRIICFRGRLGLYVAQAMAPELRKQGWNRVAIRRRPLHNYRDAWISG